MGSVAYTQRPPNYQELFADGPHVATGIVEVGDRNLGLEKSLGVDVALRKKGGGWTGSIGAFYNRFDNYITLYDSALIDPEVELAHLRLPRVGGASSTASRPRRGSNWATTVPAGSTSSCRPTTCAPPTPTSTSRCRASRRCASVARSSTRPTSGTRALDLFRVQAQNRVAPNELPTDGYTMLNASLT